MDESNWLAQLYWQNRQALFSVAWNVLRRRELAEDAVHNAFVQLSRRQSAPQDPRLYAFRVVRNAAIDLARKEGRGPGSVSLDQSDWEQSWAVEQTATADGDFVDDAIDEALASLTAEARELLDLHLKTGLSFREIGEVTGTPLQTVATRYRRALVKLRQHLRASANG